MTKAERDTFSLFCKSLGRFGFMEVTEDQRPIAKRNKVRIWDGQDSEPRIRLESHSSGFRIVIARGRRKKVMAKFKTRHELVAALKLSRKFFDLIDTYEKHKKVTEFLEGVLYSAGSAEHAVEDIEAIRRGTVVIAMMPCLVRGTPATAVAEYNEKEESLRPMFIVSSPNLDIRDPSGRPGILAPRHPAATTEGPKSTDVN